MPIGQTFPPAGSIEEHDVEKNRWRIPPMPHLHPRSPICACGHPPAAPGHPRAHHVPRPPAPSHSRGPIWSVPGIPVTHGHPHACFRTPRAPAPGPQACPMDLVGGRVWVRCCGSALLWWLWSRGPRTCPCRMGRVSGGSCRMAVHGRWIVGSILRTIPPPSTAIPQMPPVLPNSIILEKNLRDGLGPHRSDILYLVRRDVPRRANGPGRADGICRSDGVGVV